MKGEAVNQELWETVFVQGDGTAFTSGEGPEGSWFFYERVLEVDGLFFRARRFSNEARVAMDLHVYSPSTEKWIEIGGSDDPS